MTYKELLEIRTMLKNILTWEVSYDLMIEDEVQELIDICDRELDKMDKT
jgi:hypothetical protein